MGMVGMGCICILLLVGFFVFYLIVEIYDYGTEWIKELTTTEKEMDLKRMREENEKH